MGVLYYFIGGLADFDSHYEIGGSGYFMNNTSEPSYHLNSIRTENDTLYLSFSPDSSLPESLRVAQPTFMRFYPCKSVDVRVIKSLYEGDRTIQFVYFYDCIEKDGKLHFRKRTISRIVNGAKHLDCYIGINDDYDTLIGDSANNGFKYVNTEEDFFSDLAF